MLDDAAARELNAVLPRAKPVCPKCLGEGHYYDPPIEQQRQEAAEGKRHWTTRKVCRCILEGIEACR